MGWQKNGLRSLPSVTDYNLRFVAVLECDVLFTCTEVYTTNATVQYIFSCGLPKSGYFYCHGPSLHIL